MPTDLSSLPVHVRGHGPLPRSPRDHARDLGEQAIALLAAAFNYADSSTTPYRYDEQSTIRFLQLARELVELIENAPILERPERMDQNFAAFLEKVTTR